MFQPWSGSAEILKLLQYLKEKEYKKSNQHYRVDNSQLRTRKYKTAYATWYLHKVRISVTRFTEQ